MIGIHHLYSYRDEEGVGGKRNMSFYSSTKMETDDDHQDGETRFERVLSSFVIFVRVVRQSTSLLPLSLSVPPRLFLQSTNSIFFSIVMSKQRATRYKGLFQKVLTKVSPAKSCTALKRRSTLFDIILYILASSSSSLVGPTHPL